MGTMATKVEGPAATRCESCELTFYPPRERCAICGGPTEAVALTTTGSIHAHTTIYLDAFGHKAPYRLAYVDLDDGGRILIELESAAGAIAIGDRVSVDPAGRARVVATKEEK